MRILIACLVWLLAGAAIAAPRVSLIALNPVGERALLKYNKDWVEVSLLGGAIDVRALKPPLGCRWTSMAYAPAGDKIAMTAFCAADSGACQDVQSLMLTAGEDRRYQLAAERGGSRWGRIFWRGGGAEVLALESQLTTPMATNLADLGKVSEDCKVAPATLVSINIDNGQRIRQDIIPREWRLKRIVAAGQRDMIAEIAIRKGGPAEIAAAAQLDAICAASPKNNLCKSSSVAVELLWRDGDWRFASAPDQARLGRMVASADLSIVGRERCAARWVENKFRPLCTMTFERPGAPDVAVPAPDGMFGDLALSADGRWMLSVATGIGRRLKQFDLFDTTNGKRRAYPRLLGLSPPFTGAKADR